MSADLAQLAARLERHGQSHLLDGLDALTAETRASFLARLGEVDWAELERPAEPPPLEDVSRPDVLTLDERPKVEQRAAAGEAAYRGGRVAVLVVAGGHGTRLGFPGPKGAFPLAPLSRKTIYQLQAEKVLSLSRRLGLDVPLLVLTSPATDRETRDVFARHGRFGLGEAQLRLFVQGTVPSVDREGRALLAEPGRLLENPDGHGGVFAALVSSGELGRLQEAGVEHLVYVQVDNVLAPVDDPVLVGLALAESAEVVTKVLEKVHPDEKLGHLVRVGGRDRLVEYTELTPEQTRARFPEGDLVYRWGSPALHCWSVAFLARLAVEGYGLPLHRSEKPLRAWRGGRVAEVTGHKHERFVFDLVPEARRSVGLEVERAEFAPVKNAEGDDSPASAVALARAEYLRWLRDAGVGIAAAGMVEISPLYAATAAQFRERWDGRVPAIEGDLYLEA